MLQPTSKESKLRELAAKGVHQAAARVLPHYISPPGRVVELGAGAGAFSHRLRMLGYVVTGSDVEATQFNAAGVPFVCCDLDAEWPEGLRKYVVHYYSWRHHRVHSYVGSGLLSDGLLTLFTHVVSLGC